MREGEEAGCGEDGGGASRAGHEGRVTGRRAVKCALGKCGAVRGDWRWRVFAEIWVRSFRELEAAGGERVRERVTSMGAGGAPSGAD